MQACARTTKILTFSTLLFQKMEKARKKLTLEISENRNGPLATHKQIKMRTKEATERIA